MQATRKAASKRTAKNSSHKSKRAVVDELRWAATTVGGELVVYVRSATKKDAVRFAAKYNDNRVFRVRITEVTK